jgi:hypothetical protein
MAPTEQLRPVERRVLGWVAAGVDDDEIGRRFRRSPAWVAQVRLLAGIERSPAGRAERNDPLRPLERRVLRWRHRGLDHHELGVRFRRSPSFIARVEAYAQYKLAPR